MRTRVGILSAAALAAAAGVAWGGAEVTGGGQVRFRYRPDGGARSVHVAGSFNSWSKDAWELSDPDGDGTFEGTFTAAGGKHTYKFVVDGSRWVADPDNPATEEDGHGGKNSIVDLGAGGGEGGGEKASPFGSSRSRGPSFVGEIFLIEPGTERLPDFRGGGSQGKIYCESFDVAPRSFADGFPGLTDRFEWFAIRYRGHFEAETSGRYKFRLLADDGARLFIDGKLAIDNDGLHAPRSVDRVVELRAGVHELVLDYMQGPALDVALQLFVTRPRSTTEELVRAAPAPSLSGSRRRD